jgi:PrgI family protein
MPQQFVVPQFIDVEDKIIGPITTRQFLILLATSLILFIMYAVLVFAYFVGFGLPILVVGIVFAFAKINGQPFHYFFLNVVQTSRKPKLRVWYKEETNAELMARISAPPAPPATPPPSKERVTGSRLQELTLIANTGGVYRPEDWE